MTTFFDKVETFGESVTLALLRNRRAGKSPASVTELARTIGVTRESVSRAINGGGSKGMRALIACKIGNIPVPLSPVPPPREAVPSFESYQWRHKLLSICDGREIQPFDFELGDAARAYSRGEYARAYALYKEAFETYAAKGGLQ